MADQGKYGRVCGSQQAAPIPAGLALPGGVDAFVCLDGNRILSGTHIGRTTTGHERRTVAVWTAVGRQLFLVNFLFQAVPLFVFVHLARYFMEPYLGNRPPILSHFANGRIFDASLFGVGYICRIFEFRYLSAELNKERTRDVCTLGSLCEEGAVKKQP